MKKLVDFKSLNDLKSITQSTEIPSYNLVGVNVDGSSGDFKNLEEILSGGTVSVELEISTAKTQSSLALNTNEVQSLAYFGSLYSKIYSSIQSIKENYPNGFLIYSALTGSNTVFFDNNIMYTYGSPPFSLHSYSGFQLVQVYSGVAEQTFQITAFITGRTYSLIQLDGQPDGGDDYEYIIEPKDSTVDKFYSTLDQYEKDILVPPYSRTNYWPRDPLAPNNLILEGSFFESFISTEYDFGMISDNETSNFMWRRLYPDGQKNLDSPDELAYRLILTWAMNFDAIKKYQDQLLYAHTIGYENYNHIPNELVELLAHQWNWTLSHDLNSTDFSEYLIPTFENYVQNNSTQKITGNDINFERWRRVLTNLIYLYKKKGTKEGIKYLTNIYGIPENLLIVDEYITGVDTRTGKERLFASPSNIVVPSGTSLMYVDDNGNIKALEYVNVKNTKYLDIAVSPTDSINFEMYDWGYDSFPVFENINNDLVSITASTQPTYHEWVELLERNTIKSDGTARYDRNYPLLEQTGKIYISGAATPLTWKTLQPFVDYLDNNWSTFVSKMIPSSSKIQGLGTVYKNQLWNREKHQWNSSEIESKPLPLNEEVSIAELIVDTNVTESIYGNENLIQELTTSVNSILSGNTRLADFSTTSIDRLTGNTTQILSEGNIADNNAATIQALTNYVDLISPITGSTSVGFVNSGTTIGVNSPIIEVKSSNGGSLNYTGFDELSLVNETGIYLDIDLAISNITQSGYTKITTELFRMLQDNELIRSDQDYSILRVERESDSTGVYRISYTDNLSIGDSILIESSFLPYIQSHCKIIGIDNSTNTITTSPAIGLYKLPVGGGASEVSWLNFANGGMINLLNVMNINLNLSYQSINKFLISASKVFVGMNSEDWIKWVEEYAKENHSGEQFSLYYSIVATTMLTNGLENIYPSILVIQLVMNSPEYSLKTNPLQLVEMVAQNQTRATFKRVVNFFDWASPIQTVEIDNESGPTDSWNFDYIDISSRGDNTDSLSGSVTIGGLTSLNSKILLDKNEYFIRYKVETSVPSGWTEFITGVTQYSGVNTIQNNYDLQVINDVNYYGYYFTFMETPNQPQLIVFPENTQEFNLDQPSVGITWKGVKDSNKIQLQFLKSFQYEFDSYTGISSSAWTTSSAKTLDVQVMDSETDDYVYSIQVTLDPETCYWWRVLNYRNHLNLFGINLESYTSTEPYVFITGGYTETGIGEGEINITPVPPTLPGTKPGTELNS